MLEAGGTLLWKAVAAAAVQADTGNLSLCPPYYTELRDGSHLVGLKIPV